MRLTGSAIDRIKERSAIKLKLGLALGFSEQWINSLLGKNKANSPLTTMAALQVIREETGLLDSEILEESEPVAAK